MLFRCWSAAGLQLGIAAGLQLDCSWIAAGGCSSLACVMMKSALFHMQTQLVNNMHTILQVGQEVARMLDALAAADARERLSKQLPGGAAAAEALVPTLPSEAEAAARARALVAAVGSRMQGAGGGTFEVRCAAAHCCLQAHAVVGSR